MSKIKISFSLFFAIFLVGMLSTAAFASSAYHMAGTPEYNTDGTIKDLKVTFNGKDANDVNGTGFTVVVKDKAGTEVGRQATTLDSTLGFFHGNVKGQALVTAAYKFNATYTVELYYTAALTAAESATPPTVISPVEVSYSYFTDAKNAQLLNGADGATKTDVHTVTLDKDGSGLINANETGLNNTRKNRSGQKVHGFYQNNTNSCASCHQTHTAADSNLLFKDGIYSTCSACHDGTTGAYNSFSPTNEENAHSIAGTFNVSSANNGSIHEADGSLNVSAAPGGNRTATTGAFSAEFDCASCHSPHGNGTSSENNLNLDPMGWGTVAYSATGDAQNGKLFKDITIVDESAIPATQTTPYILVKRHFNSQADIDALPLDQKYYYNRLNNKAGFTSFPVDILQTYKWSYASRTKKYTPDFAGVWLREKGYPFKADTKLQNDNGSTVTDVTDLTVIWKDGFAYGAGVTQVNKAQVSIGADIETTDDIASLYESTLTTYVPGSGKAMSEYCAACHVDYLSYTRSDVTGKYTTAHRHQTDADETTCVRCHFAHGSEAKMMKDANDNTYYDLTKAAVDGGFGMTDTNAISYLKDPNPTSALKRYTGMSVCYACHGKGEQFLGNPNTAQPDKTTGEYLKDGKPGTDRTDVIYNNN